MTITGFARCQSVVKMPKKVKHEVDPVGRKSLAKQLSTTELPRGLVGNAEI